MRDDLGIGLRFECIAALSELAPQFFVVFDNAVVNDGNARFALFG